MAKAPALLLVLLLATPAAAAPAQDAQRWRHVGERDGAALYLDVSSIRRLAFGADLVQVRTQLAYRAPTATGATRAVVDSAVSCELNREFVVRTEWFDGEGRSLGTRAISEADVRAMFERIRREPRIEYSARLAPLCAAIGEEVARAGVRQSGIDEQAGAATVRSVPLVRGPGVWGVRARINGSLETVMLVDSGASLVALTPAIAARLREAGSLTDSDVIGRQRFTTADGRVAISPVVRLRSIEIDGLRLADVEASILPSGEIALLGQSFLGRLRHWSLNRSRQSFEFVR